MFSQTQLRFISIFTDEFIRELQFIVDIDRGRAQARATFFDQLIGKITLGTNALNTLAGFFPAASAAVGVGSQVVISIATGLKYLYEADMNSNIQQVIIGSKQPNLLLRLMLEGVAREAARRHEFFLNHMCAPEAVDLFAVVGVARVLQYLSDHKDVTLTAKNLLKGLIEGKSGAWQQGFTDNVLTSHHLNVPLISAEAVYGHSAQMNLERKYYVKEKVKQYFRLTDPHYVKMVKGHAIKDLPRAGVVVLRDTEITAYGFTERLISPELESHLCHYRPGYVVLSRTDIENYIVAQRASTSPLSLIEHCGNKSVICRDDLSGLDLESGDFRNVDFSGVKFGIKNNIKAKLNEAHFENAYLVNVDMSHAEAKNAQFTNANLSLVHAQETDFTGSRFVGATVFYGSFKQAVMSYIEDQGAKWSGSDLSTIITHSTEVGDTLRSATQTMVSRQDQQEERLRVLEQEILRQLQDQSQRVARSVSVKIEKYRDSALQNKVLKEILALYIPVQAALNRRSTQHFDLELKTNEFLDSDKKIMLLMGNAGEGKSTFNLYLYRKLWSEFKVGDALPVFIALPTIGKPDTELLHEHFRSKGFIAEEIEWLRTNYEFIFILDGYDEMSSTPNLYASNQLSEWRAKTIISCRSQYFAQGDDYIGYFAPIELGQMQYTALQEITTIPFNEQQITAYVTKYVANEPDAQTFGDEARYHQFLTIFQLYELIITPFLLMMALKVMPAISRKYPNLTEGDTKKIAESELYDEFMKWWFVRGVIKVQSNPNIIIPRGCNLAGEFQKMSTELAIEMRHADVMQVHYRTSEEALGNVYGKSFDAYEITTVTSAELKNAALIENEMHLLYISDCHDAKERWRIVARNNAGALTYNVKTGWLTVDELERRWASRKTSIAEHQESVRQKACALTYALTQLNQHTPETLSAEIKDNIFAAIILGLTHPWAYFFDLRDPRVQRTLPGVPVQPTDRGGYMFIHAQVLNYFYTRAIKLDARPDIPGQGKRKPWDSSPAAPIVPAMVQHGIFPASPPTQTQMQSGNTIIYQTIVQQQPPTTPPSVTPKKSGCFIS